LAVWFEYRDKVMCRVVWDEVGWCKMNVAEELYMEFRICVCIEDQNFEFLVFFYICMKLMQLNECKDLYTSFLSLVAPNPNLYRDKLT